MWAVSSARTAEVGWKLVGVVRGASDPGLTIGNEMSNVTNRNKTTGKRWFGWVRETRRALLVLGLYTALMVGAAEPAVSNVRVAQRPREMRMDLTFDLAGDDGAKLRITVELSEDGGKTYRAFNQGLTGDYGDGIAAGADKRILWEPAVEWLGRSPAALRFRVSAQRSIPGMVWIEPGSFLMGSPPEERERAVEEGPQTRVTLTKGYWMGKHEVTQEEWTAVMGSNPSKFKGEADLPVENVSWEEAMAYCRKLTERERAAGRLPAGYEYNLPTEAQWEYACRAGTTGATAFGESLSSTQANFDGDYPYGGGVKGQNLGRTAKVGSYEPNAWGLSDMHGNVAEWCLDWYGSYPGESLTDPTGPTKGSGRVIRGGFWFDYAWLCRAAQRRDFAPTIRYYFIGFRPVLAPRSVL